jgi:hypothetical protein
MGKFLGMIVAIAALASAGVATDAFAQSKAQPAKARPRAETLTPAFTGDQTLSPTGQRRSLQWNADGRWGLKLDYEQPASRDVQWKDMQTGAYFKLTPSVRFGASVGLGEQRQPHRVTPDEKPQPRVRLETTFRF